MLTNMMLANGQPKLTRHKRFPVFPVAGIVKPYGLYPVMAHPVLPGETMQSFNLKWRMLSSPLDTPMSGAWMESWLVYVKLTDLDEDLGNMFISDTYSDTSFKSASNKNRFMTGINQIDWLNLVTTRFAETYFRDEGETVSDHTIDGMPKVKLNNRNWMQNLVFEPADETVPVTDASDMASALQQWAMLQQMQMTEMSYDKYLETYGVRPKERLGERDPEILGYNRSWTLPVSNVEPSTGAPSSSFYWSSPFELTKAKKFNEPGFIVAFTTVRPKMFLRNAKWPMIGNLWGFSDWYPSYAMNDPTQSVRKIETDDVVLNSTLRTDTGEKTMLYDHNDLLAHGETFVNYDVNTEGLYKVPLVVPGSHNDAATVQELRGEYPTDTAISSLFKSATTSEHYLHYEGIAKLDISGHVQDNTPR